MAVKYDFNIPDDGLANISWVVLDDLMISFTQSGLVHHRAYSAYLDAARNPEVRFVLNTGSGATNVTEGQRKAATQVFASKKVALVNDDRLTRGIVTALGWLGLRIKCFDWDRLREAVEYLDVPSRSVDEIAAVALRLRELSGARRAKTG